MSLVIIDMQPFFKAANDPFTIDAVCEEIVRAKKENMAVILVEYHSYGATHEKIVETAKGYPHLVNVTKFRDDGSPVLVPALDAIHRDGHPIRICGVNINACVVSTVSGIIKRKPTAKIVAVKSACNDDSHGKGANAWNRFDEIIKGTQASGYTLLLSVPEELRGNISLV